MKTKLLTLLTVLLFVGFMLPGLVHAQPLVMNDQGGCVSETITFTVSVNNAPNNVSSFGFDVTYDPAILEYNGPTGVLDPADLHIGDLLSGWTMVGINESVPAGTLTIGGFTTSNAIGAGDSGSLVMLDFEILAETATDLTFDALVDGMGGWVTDGGQYTGAPPVAAAVPTMTEWGMIIMSLLLAGSAIWVIRRKKYNV